MATAASAPHLVATYMAAGTSATQLRRQRSSSPLIGRTKDDAAPFGQYPCRCCGPIPSRRRRRVLELAMVHPAARTCAQRCQPPRRWA
eukprot:1131740-Prorocentrum_lima.AAC.1